MIFFGLLLKIQTKDVRHPPFTIQRVEENTTRKGKAIVLIYNMFYEAQRSIKCYS